MVGTTTIEWHGRHVAAADPAPIAATAVELSVGTARRTEQAAAAVRAVGAREVGPLEVVGRFLLRAEGLASSEVEGLHASPTDIAVAEAQAERAEPGVAAWVADNLAVVTAALGDPGPIDEPRLLAWHRRLMQHAPHIDPAHVGAWRDRLGWVGGGNPLMAAHVGAPPDTIGRHMADLVAFLARDDLDVITHAAVAHAQFETIHPFADGNGRLGRVLIARLLSHRLDVPYPPPVSLELARDVGGYQAGLTLYRQGHLDRWVAWFADAVASSAERTEDIFDAVAALERRWAAAAAGLRADSAARALLAWLPAHPVVTASIVAARLGVSAQAARRGIESLAALEILREVRSSVASRPGRPERWWEASELVDLLRR